MQLPEPTLLNFLIGGAAAYALHSVYLFLRQRLRLFLAKHHLKKYQSDCDAYYSSNSSITSTSNRNNLQLSNFPSPDYVKDKDARVEDMAKPKGFWTRLIMNEKMALIREMIRISNSAEHRGYWQDRVEAQKRVESSRQIGQDGQER